MIGAYLDLSTGHLTQETMDKLAVGRIAHLSGWPAMTIATYDHGAFVTVPSDAEQEQWDALPADLRAVFDYAIAQFTGAPGQQVIQVLRFDSDGDQIDGLEYHDWDSQEAIGKRLARQVIGKTFQDAKGWCAHLGYSIRATSIDGVPQIVDQSIRPDRLSCHVRRSRVIEASVG